ncbi:hypothetical protein BC937DRAFT_92371 [Endogone sp. FLAS-F59071]|nr:hypothetical protein BC937DRAFT_92371 [Endogone sp. FLAS-F59071]|eukprot:RUS15494.1 hypothetical protein BC937DRAFT_92371 [Endogone sp. FLAS-F59071]
MSVAKFLFSKYFAPEVTPLVIIISGALCGAVTMVVHASKAPDVAWDHKNNPYPWLDVKNGEQVKLYALNQKYEKKWQREKL